MADHPSEGDATPKEEPPPDNLLKVPEHATDGRETPSEPPPQNQDVQDLQDQFAQQQALLSQLREALLHTEALNSSKEKEAEEVASRLSDIRSRTSVRSSPKTKPHETKKGETKGEPIQTKSLSALRQKVNESRVIFEQRGREKVDVKRSAEAMADQLRAQLAAKDETIRVLQENVEAAVASRHVPPSQLQLEEVAEEHRARSAAYEHKIADLSSQVFELESTIIGLRENLSEKDSVIDARTKAISLMSEDLCRKGKSTLDELEDTREEMRQMQNLFASLEVDMKSERDKIVNEMMAKDERVEQLEKTNAELSSEGSRLATLVSELQEKMTLAEQQSSAKAADQADAEELCKSLADANKQIVKLKAQIKKQMKQLGSLKKGAELESSVVDLQNKIAELEEEKGNLQLHMVDFDELKVSEMHLEECISRLNSDISSLEERVTQQAEELVAKDELEQRLISTLADITELQEEIHKIQTLKVQAELKAVELEESMDNITKEKNILSDTLQAMQQKVTADNASLADKETMTAQVEECAENEKHDQDELITDLHERLNAENAKYDSLFMLLASVFGDGSPEEWIQQYVANQAALSKSIEAKARYDSHLHDVQKGLVENKQELDVLKLEKAKTEADLIEKLVATESALSKKDAEVQEANSKCAKLNEKLKKVIANLKAKSMQNKTLNDDVLKLKSEKADHIAHILQVDQELDAIAEMITAERVKLDTGKNDAGEMEEIVMDTRAESRDATTPGLYSFATLSIIQKEFEHTQFLQDVALSGAKGKISYLISRIESLCASLDEREAFNNQNLTELGDAQKLHSQCLKNYSSKLAAIFAQLRSRQHEIDTTLEEIRPQHLPGIDHGFAYDPTVHNLQDFGLENLDQVSESFDVALEKTVRQLRGLAQYWKERVEQLTMQNTALKFDMGQYAAAAQHNDAAFVAYQAQIGELHYSSTNYLARISELEAEHQDQQARINDNNSDAAELRRALESNRAEYSQSIDEYARRVAEMTAKLTDLEERNKSLSEETRKDIAHKSWMEGALQEQSEHIAVCNRTVADSSEKIKRLEEMHANVSESLATELEQFKQKYAQINEKCQYLEEERRGLQERFQALDTSHQETARNNVQLEVAWQNATTKLNFAEEEVNALAFSRCAVLNQLETEKTEKKTLSGKLEQKEAKIAAIQGELDAELRRRKDVEDQLASVRQSSDATISELVKKVDNLKEIVSQVDAFKHLCDRDVSTIISESQTRAEEIQSGMSLPVTETTIIPVSTKVEFVSQDTWQDQTDEGWGWGSDEAKLEEAHQATQQTEAATEPSNAELKSQLTALEFTIEALDGDKTKLSTELKAAQVRSGKLLKKLKEVMSMNDQLSKKSADDRNSLDQTMELEFQLKITSLETELSDLKSEKAQTLHDNVLLKNRLAALDWQMSELTDDNAKMSEVIHWSEQNIVEKENKISELLFAMNKMTVEIADLKQKSDDIVADSQPESVDHQLSSPVDAEHEHKPSMLDQLKTQLESQLKENAEQEKLYQHSLTELEKFRDVHEELKKEFARAEIDFDSLQDAHNELTCQYKANQAKLEAVLAELEKSNVQLSSQELQLTESSAENLRLSDFLNAKETEIRESEQFEKHQSNSLMSKIEQLTEENQLVRDLLSVRDTEVNEMRLQMIISAQDQSNVLQNQLAQSIEENQLLRDLLDVKKTEVLEIRQQLQMSVQDRSNGLQDHMAQLSEENQVLRDIADVKETELREAREYLAELASHEPYQTLNSQLTELSEENRMLRDKLSRSDVEVNVIRQQLQTSGQDGSSIVQDQLTQSPEENRLLRDLVDEKESEISELRQQLQTSGQDGSSIVQDQLTQSTEENRLLRDLVDEKESEISKLRLQLSEIETKCLETVDRQRLELENMNNVLSANEAQAVQYVQEINNLRTALLKQSSEIEHLKADLSHRLMDVDSISEKLNETEKKYSDLKDVYSSNDRDVSKLRSRLDMKDSQLEDVTKELQEHQQVIKLLRSAHKSDKKAANLSVEMIPQQDIGPSEEPFVSQSDHNLALYSWHQQEMRVNEMSLELMQLMEERDTLQLRLSRSLRTIEEMRKLNEISALNLSHESIAHASSPAKRGSPVRHLPEAEAIMEAEEQLATKLDEVRSVGRQQRQMALQNSGVAMDASYTVSRDAQSQSETMLNWLFGKSTPKVQHI